tara:strand:- start:20768 stop:20899 length:132 start_codon:yes stop_codon:yes gene_type:complete
LRVAAASFDLHTGFDQRVYRQRLASTSASNSAPNQTPGLFVMA